VAPGYPLQVLARSSLWAFRSYPWPMPARSFPFTKGIEDFQLYKAGHIGMTCASFSLGVVYIYELAAICYEVQISI
jgi:hypothetical protein